jgi:hypothetical protein
MSRKERRAAAREDHARDLVSAITAPAPAASPLPATDKAVSGARAPLASPGQAATRAEAPKKSASILGHFVRHTYRNGELVSE